MTNEDRLVQCEQKIVQLTAQISSHIAVRVAETPSPPVEEDLRGVVSTEVTAASMTVAGGPITPGTGQVKLYTMPSGVAGTPWQINNTPVTVENWMFGKSAVGKPVLLRKSRQLPNGTQLYVIVAEGCAEAKPS